MLEILGRISQICALLVNIWKAAGCVSLAGVCEVCVIGSGLFCVI